MTKAKALKHERVLCCKCVSLQHYEYILIIFYQSSSVLLFSSTLDLLIYYKSTIATDCHNRDFYLFIKTYTAQRHTAYGPKTLMKQFTFNFCVKFCTLFNCTDFKSFSY